ncbi:CHASE domain-containing protein [Pontibacter arcticus]|uniref:histidine kinase n=1 Tax=Pontibacter arcticus TaxID=2080288 RepID=A0A364RJS5_9BACT|nr:CHASE domain-containing protein [Pontibacter arcticus]RAU84533.1 histidine kinase [Pontibacter arcticus]
MKFNYLTSFIRDYLIAILSFLLIFLLTIFVYQETSKKAEERSAKLFDVRANQATEAIKSRMYDYIQILVGAKALFVASDTVERKAWREYYKNLNLDENYPGIQGIGYTQSIRPGELRKVKQNLIAEGFPDFVITPRGKRPEYTAIIYLEPFNARNRRAFGYDMFSDPVRQSAMRMARDTKQATMSAKVRLVQETGKNEQTGFLIYLPVYRKNLDPQSITDRQKLIKGYIYSPFRAGDLMRAILGDDFNDLDVEVYDGANITKKGLIYSTTPNLLYGTKSREYTRLNTLTIGNHTWRLYITGKPRFDQSADSELPFFILVGGSIISLLMFFIIWSLSNVRRSNRLKQTITDNATAALFIINSKGYCTFMNPAAEKMTGFTFEEMAEDTLHNKLHYKYPDGRPMPASDCPMYTALTVSGPLHNYETVFFRKDGSALNVSCEVQPILESGREAYAIIEARDITNEKRAQEAIVESEKRFRMMADNAPVMIRITDDRKQVMYGNKQWIDFTGLTLHETKTQGWQQLIHPKDLAGFNEIFSKAVVDKSAFRVEYRMRRRDGKYRWVVGTNTPRLGANNEFLGHISSIIDITEIKKAEQKIKQNAELLQKLFLEVPAVVGLVRVPDFQYVLANPLYRQLYGNRQLVGKTIQEAHSRTEIGKLKQRLEKVYATGEVFVGNEMPVTVEDEAGNEVMSGFFNLVYQPLLDVKGGVEAILIFAVDVTELVKTRKNIAIANDELSEKNIELLRINNDLDSFVYTASHDLKSPIANMEGLVTLLRDILQGKLEEQDGQVLDMVASSINKLKRTIADLAEITKVQKDLQSEVEPLKFSAKLQDVLTDIEPLVQESGATIETDFKVDQILYAPKNLRSIIYNLVSNGIKYRSSGRVPVVKVCTYQEDNFIVMEVSDNGLGIKEDQQHKLFSMFRRLHTHVEGTGIGLYIIKRIIENNGGRIEVISELDKGTTFKVYFKQETQKLKPVAS